MIGPACRTLLANAIGAGVDAIMPAICRALIDEIMTRSPHSARTIIDAILFGGAGNYQPEKPRYLSPGSWYLGRFFCYVRPV